MSVITSKDQDGVRTLASTDLQTKWLTFEMMRSMREHLANASSDETVQVVLTGADPIIAQV